MTKLEIQRKRMELKKKVARRKKVKENIKNITLNVLGGLVLTVGMFIFIDKALDAWVDEIDAHAEYNRAYIQEMENNRVDR